MGPGRRTSATSSGRTASPKLFRLHCSNHTVGNRESITQKGGSEPDGKEYISNDIVALMGFAGVENGGDLSEIRAIFNATKGKNVEAYCRHTVA